MKKWDRDGLYWIKWYDQWSIGREKGKISIINRRVIQNVYCYCIVNSQIRIIQCDNKLLLISDIRISHWLESENLSCWIKDSKCWKCSISHCNNMTVNIGSVRCQCKILGWIDSYVKCQRRKRRAKCWRVIEYCYTVIVVKRIITTGRTKPNHQARFNLMNSKEIERIQWWRGIPS